MIIPHYNSFEKLERLVYSIPENENIEIIIIDDDSKKTIFSEEIVEKLKVRKNLKFKLNKYMKGAGGARNTGLELATGKWLVFADADDYFLENAFEILRQYINSDADEIFFKSISIYEDTFKKADRHQYFNKLIDDYLANTNKNAENELKYRFGVPWAKMIKREIVIKNDIKFSEIRVLNDQFFSVKCSFFSKKILANENMIYCVTRDKGSLTTISSKEFFEIKLMEMFRINKFFIENNLKKWRPHFAGFLLTSLNYNIFYFFRTLLKIKKEKGKIFPKRFIQDLFKGFYFIKLRERIKDKKYKE